MKDKPTIKKYRLEGIYGPFLRPIFRGLFSHLNIPQLYKESISSLGAKGHLVYVHANKSAFDAMLMNYRLNEYGLPTPKLVFHQKLYLFQPLSSLKGLFSRKSPFEDGAYLEFMQNPHNASLIFLEDASQNGKFDPLLELLKVQRETETPIYIIPQRLIYEYMPIKIKDSAHEEHAQLRFLKKIYFLARNDEPGFIEQGEPINLKELIRSSRSNNRFIEETTQEVRNELAQRLASLSNNLSGAPIRDRDFIIRKTMRDALFTSFLESHAAENNITREKLELKANKYLDQIAADLQPTILNIFDRTLTWIFNNIFEGLDVDEEGVRKVKEVAKQGSLVFVPCHKSHIDYLLLSYTLAHQWMSVPLVGAGINLSFFPMGYILRRSGAFFMRRTFKDDQLYSQTFAAYIRTILGERIPLEFFIEGTRSRSGKLMLPKKGLLSMILQGWESGASRDVIFVPVYMGYDMVVEEGSYVREMKGAPKEKESFWQLFRARKVLKNRYGKVYIRFSDPISLNHYMKGKGSFSEKDPAQRQDLYNDFAQEIINAIYAQTVATPLSILSCVLISRTAAREEGTARSIFHQYVNYLRVMGYNLASSLQDESKAFDEALKQLLDKNLVMLDEGEGPDDPNLLVVEPDNRIHLEYYKNNILNCFVPASLIANVLLRYPQGIAKKFFLEEVRNLAKLMEKEFILDAQGFEQALEFLEHSRIVLHSNHTYYLDRNHREIALMYAGLIENYLESYLVVANTITRIKKGNKKDLLKAINRYASRMYKKGEIKRLEALCLPNYSGAIDTLKAKGFMDDKNLIINEEALGELTSEIEAYLED